MLSSSSSLEISVLLKKRYAAFAALLDPVVAHVDFSGEAAKASIILKKRVFRRWSTNFMSTNQVKSSAGELMLFHSDYYYLSK